MSHNPNISPDLIQLEMGRGQTADSGLSRSVVPTRQKEMSYCGPDLIYDSDSSQTRSSNQTRPEHNVKLSPPSYIGRDVKTNTSPLMARSNCQETQGIKQQTKTDKMKESN